MPFAVVNRERAALIVPDRDDAGDVVLESLLEFSIRYHPIGTTSPNIVDSLRVLSARIDRALIIAAGRANRQDGARPPARLLDMCIRYAVGVDVALQRDRIWAAIDLLHRMRDLLMELYARTRGQPRSYQVFQAEAAPVLQARLGAALPQYDLRSAQVSLAGLLALLEDDLGQLSNGQLRLNESHRTLLSQIRQRQAHLNRQDAEITGV